MLTHPLASGPCAARLLVATCCGLALAAGCGRAASKPDVPVLDQDLGGQVVFATTHCEVPNADGQRCDKKTCKTDDKSNCEYFASRCLATGHNYNGDKDAGTCTRVSPD
ncbi:MAG TPA: hypothetical protein VL049_25140 [Candidatus Dormibacteraeota bacterium]|nr:hypothetical protein [Candidatus Dormibacteraeota bacterium]